MKIHKGIRNVVLAAILSAFGTSAGAQVVREVEPNHPIESAQRLTLGGVGSVTTVNGILGRLDCPSAPPFSPIPAGCLDVDFYSFDAREGTVLNVDVAKTGNRNLNTALTILGPAPVYRMERENADIQRFVNTNSRISPPFNVPATGRYTIAVTAVFTIGTGGVFTGTQIGSTSVGEYTLTVSVVSLPVQQINIDIKPGSGDTAPINPKSKGNIPVALLGSATFNPFDAYPESLTFGATGDEKSYLRCAKDGVDLDGNGHLDRVCHFDSVLGNFDEHSLEGTLKGKTKDGKAFEGGGRLKVRPAKTEVE